jgi:hypothetical protein
MIAGHVQLRINDGASGGASLSNIQAGDDNLVAGKIKNDMLVKT